MDIYQKAYLYSRTIDIEMVHKSYWMKEEEIKYFFYLHISDEGMVM